MTTSQQLSDKAASAIQQREATTGYATEAAQGAAYFQWAHNAYIDDLHGLLFHVPNEIPKAANETKQQHMMRINTLVAQGLTAGIQDYIYLGEPVRNRPTVLIELKTLTGTMGKAQPPIHARHRTAGHPTYLVRTFPQWRYVIECVCLGQAQREWHDQINPQ